MRYAAPVHFSAIGREPNGDVRLPIFGSGPATKGGVCVHRGGRVLFIDDEAARIFGIDAGDLVGRGVLELFHPESHAPMRSCLSNETGESSTVTAVTVDGARRVDVWPSARAQDDQLTELLFVRRHEGARPPQESDTAMDGPTDSAGHASAQAVLICDDEGRLATLTAGLLEEYGFVPLTVEMGEDALRLLTSDDNSIGALLLDVNLSSGLSAADLLDEIEQRDLRVGVILTSGLAPEDVSERLTRHRHVVGYLPKPYSVEQLVDNIRRALDHREH